MEILDVFVGFVVMMGLLLAGLPVATVMVAMGVAGGMILYGPVLLKSMGPVLWGTSNEPVLTAIPLFILLGELLLRSGLADRMYGTLALWLGRLPGGLLHTNIGCCSLFAATSGSSVATAPRDPGTSLDATSPLTALPVAASLSFCFSDCEPLSPIRAISSSAFLSRVSSNLSPGSGKGFTVPSSSGTRIVRPQVGQSTTSPA